MHPIQVDGAVAFADRPQDGQDPRRLDVREATGSDGGSDLGRTSARQSLPGREPLPQRGEGPVAVDITRVLRQHRVHELFDRIPTARRIEGTESPGQTAVDLSNGSIVRRAEGYSRSARRHAPGW